MLRVLPPITEHARMRNKVILNSKAGQHVHVTQSRPQSKGLPVKALATTHVQDALLAVDRNRVTEHKQEEAEQSLHGL